MTAPDHAPNRSKNILHRRRHPYMHKSGLGRTSPYPGRTYPTVTVSGMPRAVNPLSIAARIWISATCLSKSRAEGRWPSSFTQCILVSTRLRRWYPVRCRHNARPRYLVDRTASLRALAPGVSGFHNLAFLRGGITAWAFRSAIASWHLRVS